MFYTRLLSVLLVTTSIILSPHAFAGAKIQIDDTKWVSIGAGMRTQFQTIEDSAPNGSDYSNSFNLQSVRLYIAGQVHENVKMTFNSFCASCVLGTLPTERASAGNWEVLDAIAQFEFSPEFNIWAGRMLTPADRIEMNGPYYGLSWNQYNVALLPSDSNSTAGLLGRDDGVTVWGSFNKFDYAFGIFDGVDGGATIPTVAAPGAPITATVAAGGNAEDEVMYAMRFEYNFLNSEPAPAYYTSSTYFGGVGDIFTVGFSWTHQADFNGTLPGVVGDFDGYIGDFLFEKVLPGGGVINLEGEYKTFDNDGAAADRDSFFITAAYMFPQTVGIGKFQPYLRYVNNEIDGFGGAAGSDNDATELGINYRISGYDAWINFNYLTGDTLVGGGTDTQTRDAFTFGVQLQI